MHNLILATILSVFAAQAYAASCADQAKERKIAGAAASSFMKKCEADAQTSCEATAKDKKLCRRGER